MLGKIGSLNVANASSIALYEVVRQRIWAAHEATQDSSQVAE
jgi:tRNA(Leu) C34 or U34 (ribose-2'-O)-methylase TrmL